jgi:hypothetical protein
VILPGGFTEFSVINAHSPTSNCPFTYELILLIPDNSHATLLWHHLYWIDSLTVRNRVDESSIEQFQHLLLYYFPHCIIESALMLPDRYVILFHGNVMSAKAWPNPFESLMRISND